MKREVPIREITEGPLYKAMLRQRLADLKKARRYRLTNEKLAEALKIEPAYLSRCLNHPAQHPSRDLLFRLARSLGLDPVECETVLTHFDLTQSSSRSYRRYLQMKIRFTEAQQTLNSLPALTGWVSTATENLQALRAELDALERLRLNPSPLKTPI